MKNRLPDGPDKDGLIQRLRDAFPNAVVLVIDSAAFFSLDQTHWPNFATIVWTDDHDMGNPADLARPGVYRLNIGLDKPTYQRLVGLVTEPDYAALDVIRSRTPCMPKQRWVGILNPSEATLESTVMPLVAAAHDRLVRAST